ncbi:unnamed protein product [Pleuronectes platessa]|uniref:Uncharacterized protein n=1 Tax=Pleuronectes platessa TaxID=8262 RepID=A0A9N7TTB8_PLEPL|nr:unnamed protein product [Pleuronectes platessa]
MRGRRVGGVDGGEEDDDVKSRGGTKGGGRNKAQATTAERRERVPFSGCSAGQATKPNKQSGFRLASRQASSQAERPQQQGGVVTLIQQITLLSRPQHMSPQGPTSTLTAEPNMCSE